MGKGQESVQKEKQPKKLLRVDRRNQEGNQKITQAQKFGTKHFKTNKKLTKPNTHQSSASWIVICKVLRHVLVWFHQVIRSMSSLHDQGHLSHYHPCAGSHHPHAQEGQSSAVLHVPWPEKSRQKVVTLPAPPHGIVQSTFPPFTRCLRPPMEKVFPIWKASWWSEFSL